MTVIGRNAGQADAIITSSDYRQNAIISRRHARVVHSEEGVHTIRDDSRNGIFINDVKMIPGQEGM